MPQKQMWQHNCDNRTVDNWFIPSRFRTKPQVTHNNKEVWINMAITKRVIITWTLVNLYQPPFWYEYSNKGSVYEKGAQDMGNLLPFLWETNCGLLLHSVTSFIMMVRMASHIRFSWGNMTILNVSSLLLSLLIMLMHHTLQGYKTWMAIIGGIYNDEVEYDICHY